MVKALVVVCLLVVMQLIPSCGEREASDEGSDRPVVIGFVDEKRTRIWETIPHLLVINQVEYGVPEEFWRQVGQGDLVKFDGRKWTIVRKARS